MKNWDVWAVHLLTASGAALALAAALAAADNQWQLAFFWLGIALIVDGLDGPLARRRQVIERVPWFDGALLDFVIDYATYVLVPAIILVRSDLVSQPAGLIAGIVVAVVGALYFADTRMKTPDAAFRGFPAVWNVVIFQLMIYRWPEWITLLILAVCAVLTFTGVEFVHPVRVRRLRPLTLAMAAVWAALGLACLWANLQPATWIVVAFALANAYFAVIGAYLQATRPAT
ncbi:MAG TPA: CDP-alcohol phosphatidyltransferase family protein [Bauldia sp.]|nr:CDP-alcohol phosphatidyltransferase family protein [Bauldia sp.]